MKEQKRYKELLREYEEEKDMEAFELKDMPEFDFEAANLGEVREAEIDEDEEE